MTMAEQLLQVGGVDAAKPSQSWRLLHCSIVSCSVSPAPDGRAAGGRFFPCGHRLDWRTSRVLVRRVER